MGVKPGRTSERNCVRLQGGPHQWTPHFSQDIRLDKQSADTKRNLHRDQRNWRTLWLQGPIFLENMLGHVIHSDAILGKTGKRSERLDIYRNETEISRSD